MVFKRNSVNIYIDNASLLLKVNMLFNFGKVLPRTGLRNCFETDVNPGFSERHT